jgi:type IV pilus assembly protein PilP
MKKQNQIQKNLNLKNRFCRQTITLLSFVVFITACKKNETPSVATAPTPAPKVVQQPAVQKQVSSVVKLPPPAISNQIDFSNKKDPFRPAIVAVAVKPGGPTDLKKGFQGLPIHNFDVSQFRLIGIVTGAKENQAMVVDPNGKGYVLKIGMTIGKNEGRVTAISSAGVDVLEQFKDDNGRVRKEVIKITLPRKQ